MSEVESHSLAFQSSWAALALAVGGGLLLALYLMSDHAVGFARTGTGVLAGPVPRGMLYVAWGGEALAPLAGVAALLLLTAGRRRNESLLGIVGRSLCGIAIGLYGTLILWLLVAHIVIGF